MNKFSTIKTSSTMTKKDASTNTSKDITTTKSTSNNIKVTNKVARIDNIDYQLKWDQLVTNSANLVKKNVMIRYYKDSLLINPITDGVMTNIKTTAIRLAPRTKYRIIVDGTVTDGAKVFLWGMSTEKELLIPSGYLLDKVRKKELIYYNDLKQEIIAHFGLFFSKPISSDELTLYDFAVIPINK